MSKRYREVEVMAEMTIRKGLEGSESIEFEIEDGSSMGIIELNLFQVDSLIADLMGMMSEIQAKARPSDDES